MDPAKAEFLFDRVPDGVDLDDLDDPDGRADLLGLDVDDPMRDARSAMRAIVAEQIINNDPPAVWATAQRLRGLGLDRGRVMTELVMALTHVAQAALAGGDQGAGLDTDAYEAALESLPLPTPAEIDTAARALVADRSPVGADDLDAGVLARLGRAATDGLAMLLVDRVLDRLMEGSRLQVQTHSEPRLDRVLALLARVVPDARLVSDQRAPLASGELPTPPKLPGRGATLGPEVLAQIQDVLEQRWLDESVPALAGLTPRQAAADPTRRDELRRLIASFPGDDGAPERAFTMRPARLRELLDL